HALESWSAARAYDGTVTVMQPLIAPLYEGRTLQEVLACFIDAQNGRSAHDLVKGFWTRAYGGAIPGYAIADATGAKFQSAESMWKHVLHDGWVPGTRAAEVGGRSLEGGIPASGTSVAAAGVNAATAGVDPRPNSNLQPPTPVAPSC